MTVPNIDFVWQQGEDNTIDVDYTANSEPVDLTDYSLRMDIRVQGGEGTVLYTINTDDGNVGTLDEVTMTDSGRILVHVPRSISLPGGEVEPHVEEVLEFDIFLRSPEDRQEKVARGTIYYEASVTLWE